MGGLVASGGVGVASPEGRLADGTGVANCGRETGAEAAGADSLGVGEIWPTGFDGEPFSTTRASSAPVTAASVPPTAVKIVVGFRHHGTLAASTPARTRAPRSRGGET
jgi:hypothetical protein